MRCSGVGVTPPQYYSWYRTLFDNPFASSSGTNTLLHFGAVDWNATVWVNGQQVVTHSGGYYRFHADISSVIKATGNELIV